MKKCLSWVGQSIVLGSLIAVTVGVGGAIAEVDFSIDEIANNISQTSSFPVLLPSGEVLDRNKSLVGSGNILYTDFSIGIESHHNSYRMSFNNAPGSVGNAAFRFSFDANQGGEIERMPENPNPQYKAKYRQIKLADQSQALVTSYCGGTACWSTVQWKSLGVLYTVSSKLHKPDAAIEIAYSAISGGDRRKKVTLGKSLSKQQGTIEGLPDGSHYYKYMSRNEIMAFLFQKKGKMISAWSGSLTELDSCTLGQVEGNSIVKGVVYTQGYGESSTFKLIKTPADLSYMTPMTLQDAKDSDPVFAGYIKSRLRRNPLGGCEAKQRSLMDRFVAAYGDFRAVQTPQVETGTTFQPRSSQVPIVPPQPVTSRPLNAQEIALLDRTIRGSKVPSLSRSQSIDRQTLQSKSSKFMKPFAGGWLSADNQKYYIYPSTRKERQACILIEKDGTQDLQIGVANGNNSGTDINIGTARMFKTQDPRTVALRIPGGAALVPLYASPISADITPGNLEMMQQNGCMTSFSQFK